MAARRRRRPVYRSQPSGADDPFMGLYEKGDRVQLYPTIDVFGTVITAGSKFVHVKLDNGRTVKLESEDILKKVYDEGCPF